MKLISFSLMTLAVLLGGCDFLDSSKGRREELRLEMEKADREEAAKTAAATAMKAYIEGKCKLVEEAHQSVAGKMATLTEDAANLEKAVSEIMNGAATAKLSYEVRLLRVLKDATVNEIAQKYLATGFSAQSESFVARVREARARVEEYRSAVRKSEEAFDLSLETSRGWSDRNESQRQEEIARLRREIEELEKKRIVTRRDLLTHANVREIKDKMEDCVSEIGRKRLQLDKLTSPVETQYLQRRALENRQDAHWRARSTKANELYDIDRRLKPKVTELDVARDVEAATLGKLRDEIEGRRGKLQTTLEKLQKQVTLAKGMMLEIPICKGGELERLRNRADRQLTLENQ